MFATPCRKNLKNFDKNSPACHTPARAVSSPERNVLAYLIQVRQQGLHLLEPPGSAIARLLPLFAVASSILYLYFSTPTKEEKREVAEDSEQRGGQASRNPLLALAAPPSAMLFTEQTSMSISCTSGGVEFRKLKENPSTHVVREGRRSGLRGPGRGPLNGTLCPPPYLQGRAKKFLHL